MPKKKVNQPQREMTKRQLSHWQRENRRQRIILLSGIILIVAILAVVGTGLFMNQYKPYHVTVVKVGDTEYSMDYYINMLAYTGIAIRFTGHDSLFCRQLYPRISHKTKFMLKKLPS